MFPFSSTQPLFSQIPEKGYRAQGRICWNDQWPDKRCRFTWTQARQWNGWLRQHTIYIPLRRVTNPHVQSVSAVKGYRSSELHWALADIRISCISSTAPKSLMWTSPRWMELAVHPPERVAHPLNISLCSCWAFLSASSVFVLWSLPWGLPLSSHQ